MDSLIKEEAVVYMQLTQMQKFFIESLEEGEQSEALARFNNQGFFYADVTWDGEDILTIFCNNEWSDDGKTRYNFPFLYLTKEEAQAVSEELNEEKENFNREKGPAEEVYGTVWAVRWDSDDNVHFYGDTGNGEQPYHTASVFDVLGVDSAMEPNLKGCCILSETKS